MSENSPVIARLKKEDKTFEILVDCNNAMAFKRGKDISINEVLTFDKVFSDSKKGMESSPHDLQNVFGTTEIKEVAKTIVEKGDIQLTAEYRNKIREDKLKKIIYLISKNGVDPRSHTPHPINRIEAALNDAKVHIDEYKSAEQQVKDVVKKLQTILPIKFEVKEIEVIVPSQYAAKTYPVLKSLGTVNKEEWQQDGSYYAVLDIPGGLEEEFYDKLNSITHGDNQTKILRTK